MTVTFRPLRASSTAPASPFGAGPDDPGVAHAFDYFDWELRVGRPVEPRQPLDHVRNVHPALLDLARGGVEDPVVLALDVRGLRLDRDHAELAGLELAALLDRLEELLGVEVAVAEVPAVHDAGDELALAHVVVLDVCRRRGGSGR